MGYKRAQWHSGLTYEQKCEQCKTVVRYMDDKLGFRPWYADGFVYCPTCNTPLRHNERYAINAPQNPTPTFVDLSAPNPMTPPPPPPPQPVQPQPAPQPQPCEVEQSAGATMLFCSQCGAPFRENDKFCSQCGAKRD